MRRMSLCLPGYYGEMCSSAVPLVPVRGAGVGCVGSRPTCHLGLRDFLGLRHAVFAPFPRRIRGFCLLAVCSGEGLARAFFSRRINAQLLKQNNNNRRVIPCPQWLPLATMTFFGLLRAIRAATLNHTTKCYTHHIQQPTIAHRGKLGCMCRAQSARQLHCSLPHALPWMKKVLEIARWGASPLRPHLTDAKLIPLHTALHPLQMCRRKELTALFIGAATSSAR